MSRGKGKFMEILIDYLTITWKSDKIDFIREYFQLPKENELPGYGTINYRHGVYYPGCNIRWNQTTPENPFQQPSVYETCLELSGKGCRFVESCRSDFSWIDFFSIVHFDLLNQSAHIARIDLACDIKDNDTFPRNTKITAQLVQKYAIAGLYISKAKSLPLGHIMRQCATYFGTGKSDRMLRVYDKAMEQGLPDTLWTRFELQLRNACAFSAVMRILADGNIGEAYYNEINTYIRFIKPIKGYKEKISNENRDRLPNADWWEYFISGAKAIRLIKLPDPEYTIERLDKYLYTQPTSSLKAYIEAHDGDITGLIKAVTESAYNKKQLDLLTQLEIIKQNTQEDNSTYKVIDGKVFKRKYEYNKETQKIETTWIVQEDLN